MILRDCNIWDVAPPTEAELYEITRCCYCGIGVNAIPSDFGVNYYNFY